MKKNYIKPELNTEVINVETVICVSSTNSKTFEYNTSLWNVDSTIDWDF